MKRYLTQTLTSLCLVAALVTLSAVVVLALDPKGRPKAMNPNAPGGYFVWQDERGWHLRTTTGNQKHRFEGEIVSEGGTLSNVKQYREESVSWFKQQGNKITFDLTAEKNIDGIDFQASGGRLSFKLRLDDKEDVSRIQVGASGESPTTIPFTVPAQ